MKTLEEIEEIVKERLSEKRFLHSKSVMEKAVELAEIYKIDKEIVSKVAIAHDIAKEISVDEKINYCKINNILIDEMEKESPELLHSKIGADIAKKELGFSTQMTKAIQYHTTGKVGMDMLSKIIFVADSIADDRKWEGVEKGRRLAKENIDEAIVYFINQTIKHIIEENKPLHIDSILFRNECLKELKNTKKKL